MIAQYYTYQLELFSIQKIYSKMQSILRANTNTHYYDFRNFAVG